MDEHSVTTSDTAMSDATTPVATVQKKRSAVSLTGVVLGIPLLVFLVTLILPWPEPSGEHARWGVLALGWQTFALMHYVGAEMLLILVLTTVGVSVASIKSGRGVLATIGLVFLSLFLSVTAMFWAFSTVYYG